jgi:hypothetical protein
MQLRSLIDKSFHQTSFVGVLKGHYIGLCGGCLLYDMQNHDVVTNIQEANWAFTGYSKLLEDIDVLPLVSNAIKSAKYKTFNTPLLSTPYPSNYYHVTLECASSLRLIPKAHKVVGIDSSLVKFPYQNELFLHCLEGRSVAVLTGSEVHIDPIIFFDHQSDDGVDFVRSRVNKLADLGNEIVLVDRKAAISRKWSGSISETEDFHEFLRRHNVRRTEFGAGELTVSEQISRMNGAKTIISAHGAAMTNIIYLQPSVNIIELVTPEWSDRIVFETICKNIGLNYYRLLCPQTDGNGNIVANTQELDNLLERLN